MVRRLATAAALSIALATSALAADGKTHRVAIQVDQNDPAIMNMVLNNATNVIEYYRDKHEDVDIDIVAYGPGLHMLRADTSPVQDRVKRLKDMVFPGKIQFSACNNTRQAWRRPKGVRSRSCRPRSADWPRPPRSSAFSPRSRCANAAPVPMGRTPWPVRWSAASPARPRRPSLSACAATPR